MELSCAIVGCSFIFLSEVNMGVTQYSKVSGSIKNGQPSLCQRSVSVYHYCILQVSDCALKLLLFTSY
jgi:hypothetical protein